jgi:glycogen debranching enzyme
MREDEFDPADGLYRGGACFQDGIAAYPDQFVSNNHGSGIMSCLEDQPRHDYLLPKGHGIPCKTLSTNCLYLLGYQSAIKMRHELGLPAEPEHQRHADALHDAINARFWNESTGCYRYILDAIDTCERQEGLGAAFAILSGVADRDKCARLVANMHITPNGLPAVWPPYERYMGLRPNGYPRHSGTVWPQVNAAWVSALCESGYREQAMHEIELLAKNATRDGMFSEIYHPDTGLPYGGLQENGDGISNYEKSNDSIIEWKSCVRQTWAATGYIHMVLKTLFGLQFTPEALFIHPMLPNDCKSMQLNGLHWRNATLNITVEHTGPLVFKVDASAAGEQNISFI